VTSLDKLYKSSWGISTRSLPSFVMVEGLKLGTLPAFSLYAGFLSLIMIASDSHLDATYDRPKIRQQRIRNQLVERQKLRTLPEDQHEDIKEDIRYIDAALKDYKPPGFRYGTVRRGHPSRRHPLLQDHLSRLGVLGARRSDRKPRLVLEVRPRGRSRVPSTTRPKQQAPTCFHFHQASFGNTMQPTFDLANDCLALELLSDNLAHLHSLASLLHADVRLTLQTAAEAYAPLGDNRLLEAYYAAGTESAHLRIATENIFNAIGARITKTLEFLLSLIRKAVGYITGLVTGQKKPDPAADTAKLKALSEVLEKAKLDQSKVEAVIRARTLDKLFLQGVSRER